MSVLTAAEDVFDLLGCRQRTVERQNRSAIQLLRYSLAKVKKWFEDAGLESVKVELARTKCCGISLHGRKAEIGIFVASGSKPKPSARL